MTDISLLLEKATGLRNDVANVLTQPSSELVKGEIVLRKLHRVKLREAKADLSKEIANLRAIKGELDIADQYQGADIERLTDYMWECIRDERDARSGHPANSFGSAS